MHTVHTNGSLGLLVFVCLCPRFLPTTVVMELQAGRVPPGAIVESDPGHVQTLEITGSLGQGTAENGLFAGGIDRISVLPSTTVLSLPSRRSARLSNTAKVQQERVDWCYILTSLRLLVRMAARGGEHGEQHCTRSESGEELRLEQCRRRRRTTDDSSLRPRSHCND